MASFALAEVQTNPPFFPQKPCRSAREFDVYDGHEVSPPVAVSSSHAFSTSSISAISASGHFAEGSG